MAEELIFNGINKEIAERLVSETKLVQIFDSPEQAKFVINCLLEAKCETETGEVFLEKKEPEVRSCKQCKDFKIEDN